MTLNFEPENCVSEDCSVRLYQQCFYSKGPNVKIAKTVQERVQGSNGPVHTFLFHSLNVVPNDMREFDRLRSHVS